MTTCFVIGPIGDQFAPLGSVGRQTYEDALNVLEKVIVPACIENGVEAIRADQIAVAGEITEQVFRHLFEDEVVIADVSGGNANVMYELGLRHTRKLLTIQIGEYGQLPFDVRSVRTIQFSRSERGLIDARNSLSEALAIGIAEGPDPLTATRVWSQVASTDPFEGLEEVTQSLSRDHDPTSDGVDSLDRDGLLEQLAGIEEKFPALTQIVGDVGELLEVVAAESQDSSRGLEALNATGASSSARLLYVKKFANQLQVRADELGNLADSFDVEMRSISTDVSGVIEYIAGSPEVLASDDVEGFLVQLSDLAETGRDSFDTLGQFAQSARGLAPLSKSLRRPAEQISASVKTMAKAAALMDEWEAAVRRVRRQSADSAAGSSQL